MACAFPPDPVNPDLLTSYIQIAEDFIGRCEKIQISGVQKLKKKCQAELKFLQSLQHKNSRVSNHLSSSNLGHFASLLHAVENLPAVTKILHPFSLPGRDSLPVDVIAYQGHLWVKVIARKAQALHLVWAGRGQFGEKTLLDQAADYLSLASYNQVNFRTPKLCYVFYSGVTVAMAAALRDIGVIVCGETVDVSQEVIAKLSSVYDLDQESDQGSDLDIDSEFDQDSIGDDLEALRIEDNQIKNHISNTLEKRLSGIDLTNQELSSVHVAKSSNSAGDPSALNSSLKAVRRSTGKVELVHRDSEIFDSLIFFPRYYFFDGETLSSEMKRLFHEDALCSVVSHTEGTDRLLDSSPLTKVNLDITALIALISAITHGRCHFVFEEAVLSEQAAEERRCPVLPKMKEFLKGKELFACQTALEAFNTILGTLGGHDEKRRAAELMQEVKLVADQPSLRTQKLPTSSKIKERSKVIFGTGDELKMITLTANSGFVRAAKNQGVSFTVHLHSARALTQEKERSAKVINMETGETVT